MEIKTLLQNIKDTGLTDQQIADLLSTDDDKINQCVVYTWRVGKRDNEKFINRYNRIKELHKKETRKLRRKLK